MGKQLKNFRRFCDRLTAGAELVAGMQATMHRIVQPMERRARKEIAVSMFQTRMPVADARSHVSKGWKEHLKEQNEVLSGG